MSTELTLGEKRVRTKFNPSDDTMSQHVKERFAEVINYMDNIPMRDTVPQDQTGEYQRLKALALTKAEEAAMWGVKLATFGL